jgi:O-antigen/teichoic acid export membrane protein
MSASLAPAPSLRAQVRSAVIWRSGTQIFAQGVAWATTFLVIRILSPADYGLYAMTGVVLALLALMNGYGLANAAIREREAGPELLARLFGMLIVLNATLGAIQLVVAPYVAAFYAQPIVAPMLRVQALLYLTNPFLALGYAVLAREMDFRRQAQVNIASALVGAAAALAGALAGMGVWTLVVAPLALFGSRALGMALVARAWVRPRFDFAGVWHLASFGGMVTLSGLFWFVQTQADVVIAGRMFGAHTLGLYTTALFLSQIFVSKVVPPLNEVAFSAYARVQEDAAAFAAGFLKSVRLIMLLALPFSLGLAAVAEPAVRVVLGDKWLGAAPLVRLLSLAMPFMTLHVLFAPATNAAGRPGIAIRTAVAGAVLLPLAFATGVQWGGVGLAAAWLAGFPVLTVLAARWALPVVGVRAGELIRALVPPVLAALAMVAAVGALDRVLPETRPAVRLLALSGVGGLVYLGALSAIARDRLAELWAFVRR